MWNLDHYRPDRNMVRPNRSMVIQRIGVTVGETTLNDHKTQTVKGDYHENRIYDCIARPGGMYDEDNDDTEGLENPAGSAREFSVARKPAFCRN